MITIFSKYFTINEIKIPILLAIIGIIALIFVSCNKVDDVVAFVPKDAEREIQMIMAFDDVEYITYEGMELSNNIVEGRILHEEGPLGAACVSVSFNNQQNSTTIDFGDGCEGPGKKMRKGIITVTLTGKYFEPGTVFTATLENYVVNGVQLEGKLIITNISSQRTMTPSFSIKTENGRVIFQDQTFASREIEFIRSWNRSNVREEIQYHVSGFALGILDNGTSYTSEIQEELNYKWGCLENDKYLPVQGIVSLKVNENDPYILNYGTGDCDNKISISSNEKVKEVTM